MNSISRLLENWYVFMALIFFGSLALTISAGARLIPLLQRWSFGQHAYEDAPKTHAVKTGTPTMGGLLFLLALVAGAAAAIVMSWQHLWSTLDWQLVLKLISLGLACGAIGFLDDYLSVRLGRNRGLRARTKFFLTACVAVAFLWLVSSNVFPPPLSSWPHEARLIVIGTFAVMIPSWVWFAIGVLAIVATTHAVNLTDGLDGLAGGAILAPLAALVVIAYHEAFSPTRLMGQWAAPGASIFVDVLIAGAVVGFLYYNRFPARLIMGDTGSLALGGILAGSAILLNVQLLLIVIGFVFVAETLSVILQVTSFKLTGKRIFRMSPLHHHFELAGWPETKVTHRFWAASALCSALGTWLYFGWSPR